MRQEGLSSQKKNDGIRVPEQEEDSPFISIFPTESYGDPAKKVQKRLNKGGEAEEGKSGCPKSVNGLEKT